LRQGSRKRNDPQRRSALEIRTYDDVKEFLSLAESFLIEKEVENNLPLGILYSLQGKELPAEKRPVMVSVVRQGRIVLLFLMTPPHHLIISGSADHEVLRSAVRFFKEEKIPIPGIIGEKALTKRFARVWNDLTGEPARVEMDQRIYRLDRVLYRGEASGALRKATEDDLSFLGEWFVGSSRDMFQKTISKEEAGRIASSAVSRGILYLWEEGRVVSMAARARPTRHVVVVNEVYTPPEYRNRGYATASVAALSQLLLDEGYACCSLYTDLANPTSNRIYQRIGYRPVADSVMISFR